jgi:potassium-transporting ATPase KdpC subunit
MRLASAVRRHVAALRAMLVFTVILGIAYPLLVTAIAQLTLKHQANGSLIKNASGQVVASSLMCQQYVDKDGNALPQYFQARPSNASSGSSDPGCNYTLSGDSNLSPVSAKLKGIVEGRIDAYSMAYGVPPADVPQDAVTASGSGEDPDISPQNAADQAPVVAKARGLDPATVERLVKQNTTGRDLGFLGEKVVDVVTLNLALDQLTGVAPVNG